jgi:hypothetical protein
MMVGVAAKRLDGGRRRAAGHLGGRRAVGVGQGVRGEAECLAVPGSEPLPLIELATP